MGLTASVYSNMVRVVCYLPDWMIYSLDSAARTDRITRSEKIRQLLWDWSEKRWGSR